MQSKKYLSWKDIEELVDTLAKKIIDELPEIDSVTGIERGGLIPAVLLSHKLNLPYNVAIRPNTLVVDDICDTGVTIQNSVGIYTATLYSKPSAIEQPTVYAEVLTSNDWIVFPWENDDADTIQDYLKNEA